ncbi:hypothetical protein C9374_004843 [Naegleria lovaniensis]|uniref:Uncharacterized protein n=1 Tax=Naegleria lovaniensis TaxID=51637 RepID=A0AA88GKX9_NAELO|nr:uncharacterized protein C9374_004843 [Naegleria lovaniensis]KAG2382876.1 hypothetical protein C9374_004843 [Naegleria lovaniensis]
MFKHLQHDHAPMEELPSDIWMGIFSFLTLDQVQKIALKISSKLTKQFLALPSILAPSESMSSSDRYPPSSPIHRVLCYLLLRQDMKENIDEILMIPQTFKLHSYHQMTRRQGKNGAQKMKRKICFPKHGKSMSQLRHELIVKLKRMNQLFPDVLMEMQDDIVKAYEMTKSGNKYEPEVFMEPPTRRHSPTRESALDEFAYHEDMKDEQGNDIVEVVDDYYIDDSISPSENQMIENDDVYTSNDTMQVDIPNKESLLHEIQTILGQQKKTTKLPNWIKIWNGLEKTFYATRAKDLLKKLLNSLASTQSSTVHCSSKNISNIIYLIQMSIYYLQKTNAEKRHDIMFQCLNISNNLEIGRYRFNSARIRYDMNLFSSLTLDIGGLLLDYVTFITYKDHRGEYLSEYYTYEDEKEYSERMAKRNITVREDSHEIALAFCQLVRYFVEEYMKYVPSGHNFILTREYVINCCPLKFMMKVDHPVVHSTLLELIQKHSREIIRNTSLDLRYSMFIAGFNHHAPLNILQALIDCGIVTRQELGVRLPRRDQAYLDIIDKFLDRIYSIRHEHEYYHDYFNLIATVFEGHTSTKNLRTHTNGSNNNISHEPTDSNDRYRPLVIRNKKFKNMIQKCWNPAARYHTEGQKFISTLLKRLEKNRQMLTVAEHTVHDQRMTDEEQYWC